MVIDPEPEDDFAEDDTVPAEDIDTAINLEIESSCHECVQKDDKIEKLKAEVEKLRRELTVHRREREKQRMELSLLKAGNSFFREDQLKFLRKNNLKGYSWSKETLRDALKIRFSGNITLKIFIYSISPYSYCKKNNIVQNFNFHLSSNELKSSRYSSCSKEKDKKQVRLLYLSMLYHYNPRIFFWFNMGNAPVMQSRSKANMVIKGHKKFSLEANSRFPTTHKNYLNIYIWICFISAGGAGYKCLLDLGFPLPAIRTLQNRTEEIQFQPGVVTEVFELLKLKACQMTPTETLCSLVLDEMSITPGSQWDVKSDSFIGNVTLGSDKETTSTKATKCLAFMVAGISVRWKQVVYYHFTGKVNKLCNLMD